MDASSGHGAGLVAACDTGREARVLLVELGGACTEDAAARALHQGQTMELVVSLAPDVLRFRAPHSTQVLNDIPLATVTVARMGAVGAWLQAKMGRPAQQTQLFKLQTQLPAPFWLACVGLHCVSDCKALVEAINHSVRQHRKRQAKQRQRKPTLTSSFVRQGSRLCVADAEIEGLRARSHSPSKSLILTSDSALSRSRGMARTRAMARSRSCQRTPE